MSELLTQIYILGRMSDGYTGGDVCVLLLCLICMLEENYIGQGPGTPNHVCCYRNRMCKGKSWIICQKGDVNERKQLRISADKRIKTMAHTTDHMLWGPSKSGILPSMSRYPKAASETQHSLSLWSLCLVPTCWSGKVSTKSLFHICLSWSYTSWCAQVDWLILRIVLYVQDRAVLVLLCLQI